jgi:hypothetical protein
MNKIKNRLYNLKEDLLYNIILSISYLKYIKILTIKKEHRKYGFLAKISELIISFYILILSINYFEQISKFISNISNFYIHFIDNIYYIIINNQIDFLEIRY